MHCVPKQNKNTKNARKKWEDYTQLISAGSQACSLEGGVNRDKLKREGTVPGRHPSEVPAGRALAALWTGIKSIPSLSAAFPCPPAVTNNHLFEQTALTFHFTFPTTCQVFAFVAECGNKCLQSHTDPKDSLI